MPNDNQNPEAEESVQLTVEETEEIAMELGQVLILTTMRYCRTIGLDMNDPATRNLIRVTLGAMMKSIPGEPTPDVKA